MIFTAKVFLAEAGLISRRFNSSARVKYSCIAGSCRVHGALCTVHSGQVFMRVLLDMSGQIMIMRNEDPRHIGHHTNGKSEIT